MRAISLTETHITILRVLQWWLYSVLYQELCQFSANSNCTLKLVYRPRDRVCGPSDRGIMQPCKFQKIKICQELNEVHQGRNDGVILLNRHQFWNPFPQLHYLNYSMGDKCAFPDTQDSCPLVMDTLVATIINGLLAIVLRLIF